MPTVEKVSGGRVYVRDIGHFELGTRREVSEGDAEYLVEDRGDFEYVNGDETIEVEMAEGEQLDADDLAEQLEDEGVEVSEPAAAVAGDESGSSGDASEESQSDEAEQDGPADAESGNESESADGESEFDAEAYAADAGTFVEEHWQRAVSAIEDGEADHVLDELEELDHRDSVLSAIEERRAELEG